MSTRGPRRRGVIAVRFCRRALPALVCLALSPPLLAAEEGPQPFVRLNRVIERLEAGHAVAGIWASNLTPHNAAALADGNLDLVVVDMEHRPLDFERLLHFLTAMTNRGRILEKGSLQPDVVPIVRLPQNGREGLQFLIKQALDTGVYGLMLPHIETAEEAAAAVRAVRFPQPRGALDFEPAGERGRGCKFAARLWGLAESQYVTRADVWPHDPRGEILLVVQIESARGVEHIEEILAVSGIGAVFIGTNDLAMSLGVDTSDQDLEKAVQRVLAAARARKIPCGVPATTPAVVEQRLAEGFLLLMAGNDSGPSASAAAALDAAMGSVAGR